MTLLARNARMLAVQWPARSAMIESLRGSVGPLDQREVAASMVRMTARTIGALVEARVEAAVLLHRPCDFLVARQAARRHGLLPAGVALRATERAVERRVRRREGTGRDLCP